MAQHAQVYVHGIITRTFDNYFPGTIYVLEYFVSFWYLNLNFFLLTFFCYIFFFTVVFQIFYFVQLINRIEPLSKLQNNPGRGLDTQWI